MTYQDAVSFLNSLCNYELKTPLDKKFSLSRLRNILRILGHPEKKIASVHVAGTKGKGSTSAMIASIFIAGGYKVGLYTSPHLYDFRERIRTAGRPIGKAALAAHIGRLKNIRHREFKKLLKGITYFEMMTLLAILHYVESRVDLAVFEAGLGGRLDATNVLRPRVSVLTLIGFEHKDILGKTLRERAAEKAMIIKPASRVVTAPQRKVVSEIIDDRCRKFGIVPIRAQIPRALPARFEEPGRETFHIETARRIYRNLKCPLLGKHQVENASVAIHAAEALEGRFPLRRKAFYAGLRNVHWPGRIEIVNRNPIIILDSAQDKDSFKALFRTLTERFIYRRLILIIGLSRDKDVAAIARVSRGIFEGVAVKTAHPRAMTAEKIKDAFGKNTGKNIYLKPTPEEGLRMALKKATKEDMIVIAGSIYLLCEIKPAIDRLIHGSPDKQD